MYIVYTNIYIISVYNYIKSWCFQPVFLFSIFNYSNNLDIKIASKIASRAKIKKLVKGIIFKYS